MQVPPNWSDASFTLRADEALCLNRLCDLKEHRPTRPQRPCPPPRDNRTDSGHALGFQTDTATAEAKLQGTVVGNGNEIEVKCSSASMYVTECLIGSSGERRIRPSKSHVTLLSSMTHLPAQSRAEHDPWSFCQRKSKRSKEGTRLIIGKADSRVPPPPPK